MSKRMLFGLLIGLGVLLAAPAVQASPVQKAAIQTVDNWGFSLNLSPYPYTYYNYYDPYPYGYRYYNYPRYYYSPYPYGNYNFYYRDRDWDHRYYRNRDWDRHERWDRRHDRGHDRHDRRHR